MAATFVVAIGLVSVSAPLISSLDDRSPGTPATAKGRTTGDVLARFGEDQPVRFEANQGQVDGEVEFLARGGGYNLFLTPGQALFELSSDGDRPGPRISMRLVGGAPQPTLEGTERLAGVSNYLRGRDGQGWLAGVPAYAGVRYRDAYPGVDMVFRTGHEGLEYDLVVVPGADPGIVRVAFDGVDRLSLDKGGDLLLHVGQDAVRQHKPVVYQEIGGRRQSVAGQFVLTGGDQIGFRVGAYDRSRPLVIDPVITFSTYVKGGGSDRANDVAVDRDGNAYVVGYTKSATFLVSDNALQKDKSTLGSEPPIVNQSEAFITKLDPTGALVYSTYLGGAGYGAAAQYPPSGSDAGQAIAVDEQGAAYIAGETNSGDFPTTAGALRGPDRPASLPPDFLRAPVADGPHLQPDVFVSKLTADGGSLAYSGILGGTKHDVASDIGIDAEGNIYVAGHTLSADFPGSDPTSNPDKRADDGFVVKLDPTASNVLYSRYLGGNGLDAARGIAVGDGDVTVVGQTTSVDFPTSAGALQPALTGESDGFVARMSPSGEVVSSSYLGGASADSANAVALGASGEIYIAGSTSSSDLLRFPMPQAGFQPALAGEKDGFVAKLEPGGAAVAYTTYLGGRAADELKAIAVDGAGAAYVTGWTDSDDFPTRDPVTGSGGDRDAVVAKLAAGGSELTYATHLGGRYQEEGWGIAVAASGTATVAGHTRSDNFPVKDTLLPGGQRLSGQGSVFVTALGGVGAPGASVPTVTGVTPESGPPAGGTLVTIRGSGLAGAIVKFGRATAANVTINGEGTEIVAETPPNAAAIVKVEVTTEAGSATARFGYAEGTWEPTGDLVSGRYTLVGDGGEGAGQTATPLGNGKVLVAGGCVGTAIGECAPATASELYDPATGRWSATGALLTARMFHTATLLPDGRVLVVGGSVAPLDEGFSSAEIYDPTTETWAETGALNVPRVGHSATLLADGSVLVAGGARRGAMPTAAAEVYDPARDKWTLTGDLGLARFDHTATLLDDGSVLVAGGRRPGQGDDVPGNLKATETAELYDPATRKWRTTGPMSVGRNTHTATRLPDGSVLIAAGEAGERGGLHASAERYNPATGTWGLPILLHGARGGHAAALLPDGRVLVAGNASGNRSGGRENNTSEVIDPAGESSSFAGWLSEDARGPVAVTLASGNGSCGPSCGKVLLVGGSGYATELYT
ncbi:MAG: kelch repeat-containing protein, partial [Acidimicrobiales bacterium]